VTRLAALVVAAMVLLGPSAARPHAFDPALMVLTEHDANTFDVVWRTSAARIPLGRTVEDDPLVPLLPAHCRRVYPAEAPASRSGEPVFWRVECGEAGLRGARLVSRGTDPSHTDVVVRIAWREGPPFDAVLRTADPAIDVPHDATAFGSTPWALARGYGALGVQHVLEGLDHLCFVLGLFLLARSAGALVKTITAFTIAHSLSLALAALGVLTLPSRPVDVLIAASIVLVAREVVREREGPPMLAARRPWVLAFAAGLLHGLGFAGALAEIGLPRGHAALALLAFNGGVEIGQLVFVSLLFLVAMPFRAVVSLAPSLRSFPAYAMGIVGVAWVIERVRLFWSPIT
jgi:hypothetical protein